MGRLLALYIFGALLVAATTQGLEVCVAHSCFPATTWGSNDTVAFWHEERGYAISGYLKINASGRVELPYVTVVLKAVPAGALVGIIYTWHGGFPLHLRASVLTERPGVFHIPVAEDAAHIAVWIRTNMRDVRFELAAPRGGVVEIDARDLGDVPSLFYYILFASLFIIGAVTVFRWAVNEP